ncbi:hypothetical protein DAF77_14240 [Clostridioides difficile]|nr:hypothetical protein [Clostridioides difficile]EGT5014206.1 hypothetical protein [Clostridioides difficile]
MIKIEFENVEEVKEFVEVLRVVETSNNDIVCFGEVESIDSCTEENAKHALDIIKKHKHSDRKEKAYCEEISSAKTDTITCNCNNVSKDKETNESKCSCFICSKEIKDKESIFEIPYLSRDYLSPAKKVEYIKICEKCLDANSWSIGRNKKHKELKNRC